MAYTPEQRAITARLGNVSRRLRETVAAQREAQLATGRSLVDAVTALTAAIDRSNEIAPLFQEHIDTWIELLDSIANENSR